MWESVRPEETSVSGAQAPGCECQLCHLPAGRRPFRAYVDADTHRAAGKSDDITRGLLGATPCLSNAYDNDSRASFPPPEAHRKTHPTGWERDLWPAADYHEEGTILFLAPYSNPRTFPTFNPSFLWGVGKAGCFSYMSPWDRTSGSRSLVCHVQFLAQGQAHSRCSVKCVDYMRRCLLTGSRSLLNLTTSEVPASVQPVTTGECHWVCSVSEPWVHACVW